MPVTVAVVGGGLCGDIGRRAQAEPQVQSTNRGATRGARASRGRRFGLLWLSVLLLGGGCCLAWEICGGRRAGLVSSPGESRAVKREGERGCFYKDEMRERRPIAATGKPVE